MTIKNPSSTKKYSEINSIALTCKAVRFGSQHDEDAFFEWIHKIQCIDSFSGAGRELYLTIACIDLRDHDLRDLLALFNRYKIDMSQLKIFLNKSNNEWFYGRKKAYWYKKVFGSDKKSS